MTMRISIAMATYNGARYLQEQLDSFNSQIRKPDELVICDDLSTDNTLKIINNFSQNVLFDVQIFSNKHRLGYTKNFGKALSFCSGDLIFLSDQDDIWLPEKISTVLEVANSKSNSALLCFQNDAFVGEEFSQDFSTSYFSKLRKKGKSDYDLTLGCCMAIRKEFLPYILPIPDSADGHDRWISDISLTINRKKIIESQLQYYRRHNENVSKGKLLRKGSNSFINLNFSNTWESLLKSKKERQSIFKKKFEHLDCVIRRLSKIKIISPHEFINDKYLNAILEVQKEIKFRYSLRNIGRLCRIFKIMTSLHIYKKNQKWSKIKRLTTDLFLQ